ncbi:MAG: N-formylglutamate amidohydrolase [Rhodospirillales bacterium]|jgi:N-formylglutamate deformylase|nr:N-formylglutamate amidohydrolase [Rhodospirillales bacterium]
MRFVLPGVLVLTDSDNDPAPVVFDSPHSGNDYPADFLPDVPLETLRSAEDAHVDALFGSAPAHGAALLAASFPRSYVDANRAEDDLDPLLVEPAFAGRLKPSEKSRVGMGLIRRVAKPGQPLYKRRLGASEVERRLADFWRPYHAALERVIEDRARRFGAVWFVDCHSMPSASPVGATWERPDFVLGDRDGTSCDPSFRELLRLALTEMGYSVRVNDPYKGVELVRRWGRPRDGFHALQLEINRRLYMDERTLERSAGYDRLAADLDRLMHLITAWTRDQLLAAAAD